MRELILNGADYNATNQYGHTSLYIAAQQGFEEIVLTHLRNAVGRDILSLPVKDSGMGKSASCVYNMLYQGWKLLTVCLSGIGKNGARQVKILGIFPKERLKLWILLSAYLSRTGKIVLDR